MTLSDFIENHMSQLLQEWEEFARVAQPDDANLSRRELRDWADGLLKAIAEDMRTPQSDAELERQSRRLRPADAPGITKAAHVHAMDRLAQGFNIEQMVSEYRSLRTSVALRWREQADTDGEYVDQLIRFDEAMDRALSESIKRYTTVLERARDLFTAALGHDLRSPLSSILSTAEAFLLSSDELPGHHVQGAVRIRNATNRISHMIQDLLDFAHTRLGGHLPISPEEVDLAQVCAGILDEIRATWPAREIRLDCEPGLVGWFDPDRIGQLLSNLIGNALKYGHQDGTVTVTVHSTDSQARIAVHNEGDPIPQEMHRAIFEPLKRGGVRETKSRMSPGKGPQRVGGEGLGLGLYIAKEIAEAHGGQIELQSDAGSGTTFTVCLPRDPQEAGAEAEQ